MKLSPITIILYGVFICIWCVTFGWVNWAPNMSEADARDKNREAAETEANKMNLAQKRKTAAIKEVTDEAAVWRSITAAKTPPSSLAAGGFDISENGAQLIVDARPYRDSLQRAVNAQIRLGGVKLVGNGPYVPDPGTSPSTILAEYFNYPAIPFPVVILDLGTITVTGTYDQIMANVRGWSRMPNYLAVADGLRLDGTSPNLQGTYAVSVVGYMRGKNLFTPLPEIPGSTTNTGNGPTGGFGRGTGAPGGPPSFAGPGTGGQRMSGAPGGGGMRAGVGKTSASG